MRTNIDDEHLHTVYKGFKSRVNLTWHITRDMMVYYTFSQGFRPGGFNQNVGAQHIVGPDGNMLDAPVFNRNTLASGQVIEGPALIEERESTTVLGLGDHLTVEPSGRPSPCTSIQIA